MKKHTHFFTVTGFIALMFSTTAFGQGYQSFFGEKTTKYTFYHPVTPVSHGDGDNDSVYVRNAILGFGCNYSRYFNKTDTITINNNVYYKNVTNDDINNGSDSWIWCSYYGIPQKLQCYLREDTTNGRLFMHIEHFGDNEFLICDMSLNVGDTFGIPPAQGFYDIYPVCSKMWGDEYKTPFPGRYLIVDSINYINGKKIIYFSHIVGRYFTEIELPCDDRKRNPIQFVFIEGIGPVYAVDGLLLCVEKDDTLTYMTSPVLGCQQWGNRDCFSWGKINEKKRQELKVSLNLENTELKIELPTELETEKGEIYIFDAIGHVLYNKTISSNPQVINISNFNVGIYIVNFRNEKYNFLGKFIKSK